MKKPIQLPKAVVELIVPRIKDEYTAFYFYRAAANWCRDKAFFKAAEFFENEAVAETEHAKKLQDYVVDWNVLPDLSIIPAPPMFSSLIDVIEKSYDLEYDLYEKYEDISMKIFEFPDLCTFDFLQHFRTIQRESVAEYSDMLNMLEGVEPTKTNLLLLEKKLFA